MKRRIKALTQENQSITKKYEAVQERLKQEDGLWSSKDNGARHNTSRSARDMHMLEVLEDMTSTDAKLLAITGLAKEEFDHVLKDATEYIWYYPDYSRLYRDSAKRSRDPGNRCTLHIRHAVLLAMYTSGITSRNVPYRRSLGYTRATCQGRLMLCTRSC